VATRAIQYLKRKRIDFEVVKYTHAEKGAAFAAQAVGFPLAQMIKTLVVALSRERFALALMPGDQHLSLKKMAQACRAKKAAMATNVEAERLTGYLVGGISPFGTKQRLSVVLDARLMAYEQVMINAGQRGLLLRLNPQSIIEHLNCTVGDIIQEA
jgi:Cys-tRNA(Pro)/Cys-tRNA(Cys) deacylase